MSDVAVRTPGALAIDAGQTFWTEQQRAALRQLGIDEASNGDLAVFLNQAQRTGLDPFSRQLYMIGRNERQPDGSWRKKWTIQASIDGLRIIAQRSGDYAGQVGPEWCGQDGVWHDVWLDAAPPAAARVGVLRTGFAAPLYAVALYREYVGTDKQGNPTRMWSEKGALMIAKCAEALALRKAFPNDMSGVYTSEEMSRTDVAAATTGPVVQGAIEAAPENVDDDGVIGDDTDDTIEAEIAACTNVDELRAVWNRWAGSLPAPGKANLSQLMTARREQIEANRPSEPVDDVEDAEILEAPVEEREPATRTDLQRLSMRLTELGIGGRQEVLDWVGEAIGRTIKSRTELTRDEAQAAVRKATLALGEVPDEAAS